MSDYMPSEIRRTDNPSIRVHHYELTMEDGRRYTGGRNFETIYGVLDWLLRLHKGGLIKILVNFIADEGYFGDFEAGVVRLTLGHEKYKVTIYPSGFKAEAVKFPKIYLDKATDSIDQSNVEGNKGG